MAADIKVKGIEPLEVAKYCESIGVKGIGLYSWGCHIDTRTKKAFWKTDKQIKVDTFGGNTDENIKEWQKAAIADGFDFKSGADGIWGAECEAVAEKAICKKRIVYKYKNLTKIVQRAVGIEADGKYGTNTKKAVQKWQGLVGLTADGVVGKNTWKKILGVK
jgi:peptidoglycan hydrolase-like protein with peptidoglycan-binding domain